MSLSEEVYNFSAGPAVLPKAVLEQVQEALLDYRATGLSVMSIGHRSALFLEILHGLEQNLSRLLGISQDYAILFLQGGASLQFTNIISNLSLSQQRQVGCVVSGNWSRIAYQQMTKMAVVNTQLLANSEKEGHFLAVPVQETWQLNTPLDFIHFTSNETVNGVQYQKLPTRLDVNYPWLVCDMSSDFLTREVNLFDYGLVYAGAQKNIGPSGVTVVIVRRDLLDRVEKTVPDVLSYRSYVNKDGMYNTPNTFGIYVCGLVCQWLLDHGGLAEREKINTEKANLLYQTIDESDGFYFNRVRPEARSRMNVVFHTETPELDARFIAEADRENLKFLKGYKSLGGMRASIYNAMPLQGVRKLCEFMRDFQERYT